MQPTIKISNIIYLQKRVKDYYKPFRFTTTLAWMDGPHEHGVDIVGCLGGVGRDGKAEWRGPCFMAGVRPVYSAHFAPGTYEKVLKALIEGGYMKYSPEHEILNLTAEELGLPKEVDVQ
jgi:hypothetical protein